LKHAKPAIATLAVLAVVALGPSILLAQPAQPGQNGPSPGQNPPNGPVPGQTPPAQPGPGTPAPAPGQSPGLAPVAPVTPAPITPTHSVSGVVTAVDYVGCQPNTTPATCSVMLSVLPGATSVPMTVFGSSAKIAQGGNVIDVSVPSTVLTQTTGQPISVMNIVPGDQVRLDYATVDNANIATSLAITGTSPHWDHEAPY
jgi:hypothetical protein